MPDLSNRLLLVLISLLALNSASRDQSKPAVSKQPPLTSRAILISINGLSADQVLRPEKHQLRLPNICSLRDQGASAVGVDGVYPSLTRPAHATMVTGMLPVDHGIFADYEFDEKTAAVSSEPFSKTQQIGSVTIWDSARRAGLTVFSVGFPLTSGAEINFNLDAGVSVGAIVDSIQKNRPNLVLINFTSLEVAQVEHGVAAKESVAALEKIDAEIGQIVTAFSAKETAFLIVSDAARAPVDREFRPNAVLAKKGLLTTDKEGRVTSWSVFCQAMGGAAAVFIKDAQDEKLSIEVAKTFYDLHTKPDSPVWRIVERKDAARLGADPRPAFFIDAAPLYAMSSEAGGNKVGSARVRATSGYLPQRSEMRGALVIAGPGIKPGVRLQLARLIDIAPTLSRLLGLEMRATRGRVLSEAFIQ